MSDSIFPPHGLGQERLIYLQGSKVSIFDLFGNDYTLVDFSSDGSFAKMFADAAKKLAISLKTVHSPKELHTGNLEA